VIITFTSPNNDQDFVAVDGGMPMAQARGGCRTMFSDAHQAGGLSFSDTEIPGWAPAKCIWNNYWYAHIKDYGYVYHGHVVGMVSDALGFKTNKTLKGIDTFNGWWSAGNRCHLLNPKQYQEWSDMGDEEGKKYIDGLFPPVGVVVVPAVEPIKVKAPRARRAKAVVEDLKV
jgi:hypothetical protein